MKKILIVCGTGASSGFMAASVRKAAKARKEDLEILARSDYAVEEYAKEIALLLVGPHLSYILPDLERIVAPYGVPVKLIPDGIYGALDGNQMLDFILENLK